MLRSFSLKAFLISFFSLLTFSLLSISCASDRQIRTLKEAHEAFHGLDMSVIDPLLDASLVINRDIQMSALGSLDQYVERIIANQASLEEQLKKVKDAKLKINLEKENQKLSNYLAKIQRQLQRLFALSSDFNVKNLCLISLARIPSQDTVDFLTSALSDTESTTVELTLKELRPFLNDADHYSLSASLTPTLSLFSKSDFPLFNVALSNLCLYPPSPVISNALRSYRDLTTDKHKTALLDAHLNPKASAP
jgi:hypothetical protein